MTASSKRALINSYADRLVRVEREIQEKMNQRLLIDSEIKRLEAQRSELKGSYDRIQQEEVQ